MPPRNKYYAVVRGREVGIFTDYKNGAQISVHRFPNCDFEGFASLEEALQFMSEIREPDIIGNISEDVKEDMRRVGIFDNYDIVGNRSKRKIPIAACASLESQPETCGKHCFCGEDASCHAETLLCIKCLRIVHKTCTSFQENENRGNGYICERCLHESDFSRNPVAQVAEDPVVQVAEDPVAQVAEDPVAQAAQELREILL